MGVCLLLMTKLHRVCGGGVGCFFFFLDKLQFELCYTHGRRQEIHGERPHRGKKLDATILRGELHVAEGEAPDASVSYCEQTCHDYANPEECKQIRRYIHCVYSIMQNMLLSGCFCCEKVSCVHLC